MHWIIGLAFKHVTCTLHAEIWRVTTQDAWRSPKNHMQLVRYGFQPPTVWFAVLNLFLIFFEAAPCAWVDCQQPQGTMHRKSEEVIAADWSIRTQRRSARLPLCGDLLKQSPYWRCRTGTVGSRVHCVGEDRFDDLIFSGCEPFLHHDRSVLRGTSFIFNQKYFIIFKVGF